MGRLAFSKDVARTESELLIPDSIQGDSEALSRLEDGIEVVAGLLNPHVVPVRREAGRQGRLRLRESHAGGESLEQRVQGGGRLTADQALEITARVAEAVASLHRAEQPHGAVIADHVRLTPRGDVQLEGAGAYELFRRQPPPVFAELYADERVGYQEAGRMADLEGLRLILLYALFGAGEEDRSFLAFADRLRQPREGAAMLRRLLGQLDYPLREFVVEQLEADESQLLEERAAAQLASGLRSLKSGEVELPDLSPAAPASMEARPPRESPGRVRQEAAVAVAALLLLVSMVYFPALFWFWRFDSPAVPHRGKKWTGELLTLPGKNGTWWAEDPHTYWLLPPLREAMVEKGENVLEEGESGDSKPVDIYHALDNWFEALEPAKPEDTSAEHAQTDSGHSLHQDLQRWTPVIALLDPRNTRPDALLAALERIRGDDATTWHVKAVLWHRYALAATRPPSPSSGPRDPKAGDAPASTGADPFETAKQAYQTALAGYRRHAWHQLELMALCYADYAELLLADGDKEGAAAHFALAHRLVERSSPKVAYSFSVRGATREQLSSLNGEEVGEWLIEAYRDADTPLSSDAELALVERDARWRIRQDQSTYIVKNDEGTLNIYVGPDDSLAVPFLVTCYCKESLCYRSQGHWTRALSGAESARALCERGSVPKSIAAYQFERAAWLHMDLWNLDQAQRYFEVAGGLRKASDHFPKLNCSKNLCETRLRTLHNDHGVAMARRYLAEPPEDVQDRYRMIVEHLENNAHFPTHSMRSFERERYDERLLNSLQRHADSHVYASHLFGSGPGKERRRQHAKAALRDMLVKVRRLVVLAPRGKDYEARLLGQLALLHATEGDLKAARRALQRAELALRKMDSDSRSSFLLEVVGAYLACRECPKEVGDGEAPQPTDPVARLLDQLKAKIAAGMRERTFGRDELDIVLVVCRLVAQQILREAVEAPNAPESVVENARTLAFLLHKLVLTPRQQQVNAGVRTARVTNALPMSSYFRDAYQDIIRLVSHELSEENQGLLEVMRKDDGELEQLLASLPTSE